MKYQINGAFKVTYISSGMRLPHNILTIYYNTFSNVEEVEDTNESRVVLCFFRFFFVAFNFPNEF